MTVKIIEKHSLPLIKYSDVSGGYYALLDTGCDNTLTYLHEPEREDNPDITLVGISGEKKDAAYFEKIEFDLDDADNEDSFETFECNALIVKEEVFQIFNENNIPDVKMVLGMNFFEKYKAKIDIENKILTLENEL